METTLDTPAAASENAPKDQARCFHCGTPCPATAFAIKTKPFCCRGCRTVYELLTESGLADFYTLADQAGAKVPAEAKPDEYRFLDEPGVRERIVNFSNATITKVTFHLPAIHCIACVWLLENLFRLQEGVGHSQVHFPRREVSISFAPAQVKLSTIAALLSSLGYPPDLKFSDLEKMKTPLSRRLWLQLGLAGFAFGNLMLLSISSYLGWDEWTGKNLKSLSGGISFVLALPVFFYSASDYWQSAWQGLRQRRLTIEVPIAAGLVALFGQSAYEVFAGGGEGYFDSLCGLVFFLLCGRCFQQKAYDRLAFDRDFKSFFPLAVTRENPDGETRVALAHLQVGDRLRIRHGELIPADAQLLQGSALIDYSFVTGEAEPIHKNTGDHLYAGGRQIGGAITVEMVKAVSQSYLASLWNQEAFRKEKTATLHTLTNVYSYRFTKLILAVALGAAGFWWFTDATLAVKSFTAILIVACPCALALAAPFALGTGQRLLARHQIFLKNPSVIESLAKVSAIVFDKTGTLTSASAGAVEFVGLPLTFRESSWVLSVCRQSPHPQAARLAVFLAQARTKPVDAFQETSGSGMTGWVEGQEIWMGSPAWLATKLPGSKGTAPASSDAAAETPAPVGSSVDIAINGQWRGSFKLANTARTGADQLIRTLSEKYELALLSGDHDRERERFRAWFGPQAALHFQQSPLEKLQFIERLRHPGRTVMMVGDGLNDAGALQSSDVGVAVVENVSAFSPASDVIMNASMVPHLGAVLRLAQGTARIVKLSFTISSIYNVVGVSIAASGNLSPVVCAILMPLSSVSVVVFACGATAWLGRRMLPHPKEAA